MPLKVIRDKWLINCPSIYELLDNDIPDKYRNQIIKSDKFLKFKSTYRVGAKALATRLLHQYVEQQTIIRNPYTILDATEGKVREVWIQALQKRTRKVISPVYNAIIFDEKLKQFIEDEERSLNCTLLPKPKITKIIPHLPLKKLHKEGYLHGGLFDYKVKWWFFSKEDAEKLAIGKNEHICKYRQRAQDKAHAKMIEENVNHVQEIIWNWLYFEGYYVSINSAEFDFFGNKIFKLASVKQLISSISMKKASIGFPLDAKIYLEELFNGKMDKDKNFAKKVEAELKEREVNPLED